MTKLFIAAMAVVAALSLSGCDTLGKGKAPVVTNG